MLYSCVINALDMDAKNKIQVDERSDPNKEDGDTRPSGVMLLRLIIRKMKVNLNASTSSIRKILSKT